MSRLSRILILALALGTLAVMTGCGGAERKVFAPSVVTRQDVVRYPPGSPERAALQMARVIQFNAPTAAADFFAPSWHVKAKQLSFAFEAVAPLASKAGAPRIVSVRRHGANATVDASWLGIRLDLRFRRIHGRWRLLPVHGLDLASVQHTLQAAAAR